MRDVAMDENSRGVIARHNPRSPPVRRARHVEAAAVYVIMDG